jgi:hypothetical protein
MPIISLYIISLFVLVTETGYDYYAVRSLSTSVIQVNISRVIAKPGCKSRIPYNLKSLYMKKTS